jgi:outer membrane receptor for ferrienterochelin and colicin
MPRDRSSHVTFSGSVTLGVMLLAQPSAALDTANYFELDLEQLLELKVRSVSKKEEPIANAPAAVYVVTSEDITRSGVTKKNTHKMTQRMTLNKL